MKHAKKGRIELITGLLLLAAALSFTVWNLWQDRQAERASRNALSQIEALMTDTEDTLQGQMRAKETGESSTGETEIPDYILNPQMDMPTKEINGHAYLATLDIPALELQLPILSDYVFDHLRISPCRFVGSAYTDDMVICAHNYDSHFGTLKYLSPGDTVTLTDMDGSVFSYVVREILILEPYEIEEFTKSGYALTLFTCTVGGEARVTVRCDRLME